MTGYGARLRRVVSATDSHDEQAAGEQAGGERLAEDERAQDDRDHRVDVGVGADGRRGQLVQAVGERGEAHEGAEDDEVADPAPGAGRGGGQARPVLAEEPRGGEDDDGAGQHLDGRRRGEGQAPGHLLRVERPDRPGQARHLQPEDGQPVAGAHLPLGPRHERHPGEARPPSPPTPAPSRAGRPAAGRRAAGSRAGTVATISAAIPLGTVFSAHITSEFPTERSSTPMSE